MIRPTVEVLLSMVDNFSAPLRSTAQGVQGIANGLSNAVKGMVAAAAAYVTADFFKGAVEEAMQAEVATGQLALAVTNAGQSFAEWQPKIDESINRLTKLTRFGDDDFRAAMTTMVAKSGDVKGSLGNLGLAADIAAMKGISLADAGDLVGKVMAGNLRPLKEFGIKATDSADAMEQLRARTRGYAEQDLQTMAGRIAQAQANFGEFKEQIGKVILGTDGLGAGVSGLSAFLADLATWIEENQAGFAQLTGTLTAVGSAVMSVLGTIWDLLKGIGAAVDAVVGWGNIWRGLQIAVTATAGIVQAFAGRVQEMVGLVVTALGRLLDFAAPVLDKFGLSVGAAAENLLKVGRRLQEEGEKAATDAADRTRDKILLIATQTETGQKQMTKSYEGGAAARGAVVDRETKAEKSTREKSAKALEDLEKLAHKGQLQLLTAQQREYEELVRVFREKMQGLDKADKAKAEELLKTAHANLLMKWAGFGKALEPTVIQPITKIQHATELMTATMEAATARAVSRMHLIREAAVEIGNTFVDSSNRVLDFADAVGASDARMRSLVGGVGFLGEGIAKLGTGDFLGGITAGIGGLTSILGGIFGDSPADRARKALLQKNNERLAELRDKMDDLLKINTTGAKIAAFQGVDLQGLVNASQVRDPGKNFGKLKAGDVGKYLARQGLSLTDFRALAAELGYDLGADPNFLDPAVVVQLLDFVKTNNFAGVGGSGFAGEIERLDFLNGIENTDSTGVLSGLAGIAGGKNGSGVLAGIFAGADFTNGLDAGEIGSIRTRAIGVGQDLAAGRLTANDLGGLSNSEFIRFIERILGALETTANNTAATAEASAVTASATATTAEAVGSGRLATVVDGQVADQYAVSSINAGRI